MYEEFGMRDRFDWQERNSGGNVVFCEVMNGLGIWPDLDMIRI